MSLTSRRTLYALRLLALALIALHLLAPGLPEASAWGLWPFTYLPPVWRWGLALAAALLVLFGERLWQWGMPHSARVLSGVRWSAPHMRLILAAAAGLAFWLFRIRHLRWGDAHLLVAAIPHPEVRLTYVWQAPLDLYLHARLWQLANRWWGWPDPVPVYWVLSTLAGVAFVWILLALAHWLGRNRTERVVAAALVLSLGTVQLFFGYIENYSIMTVGVLLYAYLGLRALRREIPLVWPASVLAITHAFHPSTIILAPSLVYLTTLLAGPRSTAPGSPAPVPWRRALLSVSVPYVVVFAGVLTLLSAGNHGLDALLGVDFPGGGDAKWFVPLFEVTTEWQHYTMFSLGHLVDILNQQLLSAPAIWPGFILAAVFGWRALPRRDQMYRLLAFMAFSYLVLILTWNPDYGGQRDWDLFSPAAVPAALLLAYVLPRVLPERPALRAAGLALIASQSMHTVAWIYQNTLPYAPP